MHRVLKLILPVALGLVWLPSLAAPASISDARIEQAVSAVLADSETVSGAAGLKVRCDEGILTLGGKADTLYALSQAVRRAGAVPGVVDVVVTATVPRLKIPDSQILADVQLALQTPSFSFMGIQASVGGGRVVLTGKCGSYAQKLLAEQEISKISGVVEMQNRIDVTSETNVSEEALSRLVLSRLSRGPTPVAGRFQVSVHGKLAILTGRVSLYLNRLEASEIALGVPGINEVDNRLVVDPSLSPPPSDSAQP
jgi:osmotically-inducible protein OsmY